MTLGLTKPANTVFDPLDGSSQPRGASMEDCRTWGTEIEALIEAIDPDVLIVRLTATTTYYFDPTTGSDIAGTGSAVQPYRTIGAILDYLRENVNINGQTVVIRQLNPGTLREAVVIDDLLPGQSTQPGTFIILGNTSTNVEQCKDFVWSPQAATTALSVTNGAVVKVQGFYFDYTLAYGEAGSGSSRIAVNSSTMSTLWIDSCGFGFAEWNAAYVNVQDAGTIQFFNDNLIDTPRATATASSLSTGSTSVTISGLSGALPLTPGVGVSGTGIASDTYVTATNGSTSITLNRVPSSNQGATALTFHMGVSTFLGVGQKSLCMHSAFNAANSGLTYVRGDPHFLYGPLIADEQSHINWGSLFIEPDSVATTTATGTAGTAVLTVSSATGILVGDYAHGAGVPFAAKVSSIVGTTVTLNANLTAPVNGTVKFGAKPATIGPQLSAWGNSVIKPPNQDSTTLPGSSWILSRTIGVGRVAQGSQIYGPANGGAGGIFELRSTDPDGHFSLSESTGKRFYIYKASTTNYAAWRSNASGNIVAQLGQTAPVDAFAVMTNGDTRLNDGVALATNAVARFALMPAIGGVPSGVPTNAGTGQIPFAVNTAAKDLRGYIGGAWYNLSALGGQQEGYVANRYYCGEYINAGSTGTAALVADRLYATPFRVRKLTTWTRIGIDVTVAAAAGKKARLGIWTAQTADGLPGTLILDAGEIAVDATGLIQATISQALQAGEYWLTVVTDGAPTVRVGGGNTANENLFMARFGAATPGVIDALTYKAFTYGALSGATPFGTVTFSSGNPVMIFLRVV